MKLLRNLSLGLAVGTLTAAGALLSAAQPANAQGAPPGFLQLPGTNTSLLITGQVGTRLIYDSIQTGYPGFTNEQADALVPIFIGVGHYSSPNVGNIHFSNTDANIGFITSTQTAWGPLQTVLILASSNDAFTANNPPGLANFSTTISPLLGFATLGPIMVGLNTSLFGDDDANPTSDMMNEPLGVAGVIGEIVPSFRYTWVGPNGFSLAASIENSISEGVAGAPVGNWDNNLWPNTFFYPGPGGGATAAGPFGGGSWGPDNVWSTGSLDGNMYVPNFVVKARLDQPWGHVALAALINEQSSSCSLNCTPTSIGNPLTGFTSGLAAPGGLGNLPDVNKTGWGLNLTGHLNTWGKDKLMAGFFYGQGLGTYMGDYGAQAGMDIGPNITDTGWLSALPTEYGGYVAYKHFWTGQLRSTVSGGASHISPQNDVFNNGGLSSAAASSLVSCAANYNCLNSAVINGDIFQSMHWSLSANLIWSPVNNVDLGAQIIYYHVTTADKTALVSDNEGHDLRIEIGGAIRF